jgi:hypothetical protein
MPVIPVIPVMPVMPVMPVISAAAATAWDWTPETLASLTRFLRERGLCVR